MINSGLSLKEIRKLFDMLKESKVNEHIIFIDNAMCKEFQNIIETIFKQNLRLNNIINELEKYIDDNYFYDDVGMKIFDVSLLTDKLKELKESDENE